ncbi:SH3 domain-containing protein [Pedobacter cryophilus]|uniref:SH3 domain-containing protein n=1 Tax=Pedobacter cryophilus TaxID=2571271 RepID=A0A4U1BX16_9SPHI|nr:SH3 domain-containing protein [Pedobacter cryophilus]TKB95963.1 SH3 domain-containing protein [Pedobacter cryophilus]
MKITIFCIILFIFSFKINAAENYKIGDQLFVASSKGLNLRLSSSLDSKIIKTLVFGSKVEIIDTKISEIPFSLFVDDFWDHKGIELKGFWVKVKSGDSEGYVFDGILTKKKYVEFGVEVNQIKIFGEPKIDTLKKISAPMKNGIKYPYQTIIKTFSNLIEEETFFDGCWNVKQTFRNISFNEVYWLINRDMINADAIQEVKIIRTKNTTIITYYSCT